MNKDILNEIKTNNPYQIKTTSQDILNKYNTMLAKKSTKKEKNKVLYSTGLGLFGVGLLSITLAVFLSNNFNSKNSTITPSNNKLFAQELITFSNFYHQTSTSLKLNKASQNDFEIIVNQFDSIQEGIFSTFNLDKYTIKDYSYDSTYLNISFDYYSTFSLDNNIIATLYYNEISSKNNNDETEITYQAIYNTNNMNFNVTIEKEEEKDEQEIKVLFSNLSADDSFIHLVKKESEIEYMEKEHSFSYSIYENIDEYKKRNELYSIEYSLEEENSQTEIEITINDNNHEYEFTNIVKIENTITFHTEMETNYNEIDLVITLTYFDDYRLYTTPDLEEIKKY